MIDADSLNEIQELNMTYMLLAKQLLKDDREAAIFRLGVTEEVADYILSLTAKKMSKIARSNQFLCTLRFDDIAKFEATLASYRDYLGTPSHHSLYLASQSEEK